MSDWLSALVQVLQVINLFAWGTVSYLKFPALRDAVRKDGANGDERGAVGFCFGLLQVDFIFRWLLWPSAIANIDGWQLADWASCYAFSTILAVHYARLILKGRK